MTDPSQLSKPGNAPPVVPTDTREAIARMLVPYWYGGFERQEQNKHGHWEYPPGTPNAVAYEIADRALMIVEQRDPAQSKPIWPEPIVTNPDIADPTGVPYIDSLIHRLLDAQQDINVASGEQMSQSLCDASALIDEVETTLRAFAAAMPPPALSPQERPQNPNGTPRATIAVWLNEHPGEDVFTAGEAIWAALQADGHVPDHSQEATAPQGSANQERNRLRVLFYDHYWDSLQGTKDIVMKHIESVLDMPPPHSQEANAEALDLAQELYEFDPATSRGEKITWDSLPAGNGIREHALGQARHILAKYTVRAKR